MVGYDALAAWVVNWYGPNCPCSKEKYLRQIYGYLEGVTHTPEYQRDPRAYVTAWVARRSNTQELRILEDPVLLYLRTKLGL